MFIFLKMFTTVSRFLLLLVCYSSFGQIETLHNSSQHYTTESGLPQSYVSKIIQDEQGFIWVATLDGLARFDGHRFLKFNIDEEDRKLSTSLIYDIYLDDENQLWVFHRNHVVDVIDPQSLEVKRKISPVKTIPHDQFDLGTDWMNVRSFVNDHRGNWFAGDTVSYHLYDGKNTKLSKLFSRERARKTPTAYGFMEDKHGSMWILTEDGLSTSDTSWANYQLVHFPGDLKIPFKMMNHRPMMELSKSRILFAVENRLFVFDKLNEEYREIQLPSLSVLTYNSILVMTKDNAGRAIIQYLGYVLRLEEDETVTYLWENPLREKLNITSILIDRSNTMWVGVNTGGMFRVDLNTPKFHSFEYEKNFLVDILTKQLGIDKDEIPDNWRKQGWSYGLRYCYSNFGLLITHESYGYGDARRIYKLENGQLNPIPLEDKYFHYVIGMDEVDSTLWAADIGGTAFKWKDLDENPEEREVKKIPDTGTERISDLTVDKERQWLIVTRNILYELDDGKIIKEHKVGKEGSSLIDISQDLYDEDILWIGTLGGGLVKWDKLERETKKIYSTEDGLPSNSIGSIVPDSLGNLWLGTFNGISQFFIEKELFTNFTMKDGLVESEFNRHHGLMLPDGRVALGGTVGYSVFEPETFESDTHNPITNISDFTVNGKPFEYHQKKTLVLPYDQNELRLELAATQYNAPEAINYRYKLENFNSDWVNNRNQTILRFDKLPPGRYRLLLNASNTNGIWSEHINTINITIKPPPWLSWWAYTLYTTFGLMILALYWRTYKRRIFRKQEQEFNQREAKRLKEIDAIKTRFFSNITHEFRTPLTLILSPLERELREKSHSKNVIRILENNYRQGNHLLKLVNQLLDISKLESGSMMMHKSAGDLNGFVKALVDQFQGLAEEKGIHISFSVEGVEGNYLFDKSHLEKIIMNLVGNATKFTPEGGQVKVMLTASQVNSQPAISLKVVDTGIGIPKEKISVLFDRFYQVDDSSTRQQEGTGIGLSLVKELADLMGATISVESIEGKGSTFELILPVEKLSMKNGTPRSQSDALPVDKDPLILVVEDNDELRDFIVDSLSSDLKVIVAENGMTGWRLTEKHLPDIIISDIMMPEMDGYELCKKVKDDPRTNHIGVILLTAKMAQSSKEVGLACGADDYMTKPFHSHELELRVKNALAQQERLKEKLRKQLLPGSPSVKIESPSDIFLSRLYQFLDDHHTNSKLEVSEVAEAMGMSKSTLNRKLRSLLSVSALNLIKQYRLQRAVGLLESGESISAAAYSSGFESPSYFTQVFKESFGKTPSDFKRAS